MASNIIDLDPADLHFSDIYPLDPLYDPDAEFNDFAPGSFGLLAPGPCMSRVPPSANQGPGLPPFDNQYHDPYQVNNELQLFPHRPGIKLDDDEAPLVRLGEQNKKFVISQVKDFARPPHNKISSLEHDVEVEKAKVRRLMQAVQDRDDYIEKHHLDPLLKVNLDGVEDEARAAVAGHGTGDADAVPGLEGADEPEVSNPGAPVASTAQGSAPHSASNGPFIDGDDPVDEPDSIGTKSKANEMALANDELVQGNLDEMTATGAPKAKKVKKSSKAKENKNVEKKPGAANKTDLKDNKKKDPKKVDAIVKQPATKLQPSKVKLEAKIYKFDAANDKLLSLNQACAYEPVGNSGSLVTRQLVKATIDQLSSEQKSNSTTGVLLIQRGVLKSSREDANAFYEVRRGELHQVYIRLRSAANHGGDSVERRFVCVLCEEIELPLLYEYLSTAEIVV